MRYHSYMLTIFALAGRSLALPDGVGGHHHHGDHGAAAPPVSGGGYAAPEASYSSPGAGYASPDAGYGAPDAGYATPDAGYGAPDAGYSSPDAGYASPSGGYDYPTDSYGGETATVSGSDGMSMIIIPLLIAAALFLLFPSVTTVPVRKRRDVDESTTSNMINRVQDMYMAIMESEECIERVVCELGGLVEDAGYSKQMTRSLELFAPKKYQKMMKSFNKGKDCTKNNKCGIF